MVRTATSRAVPAKSVKAGAAKPVKKAAATVVPAPAAKKAAPAPKTQDKPVMKEQVPANAKPDSETKEKNKKVKLVRDSFTMPEAEYAALGEVKKACLKAGIEVKKSELLRVGVALIRQLETSKLKEILAGLPALKAGRPKKTK